MKILNNLLVLAKFPVIFLLLITTGCQEEKSKLNITEQSLAYIQLVNGDKYSPRGSGFIIAKNKGSSTSIYILTANHLIGKAEPNEFSITTHIDNKKHLVKSIKNFEDIDLALLEIDDNENYPVLHLAKTQASVKSSIRLVGMANCNFKESNKYPYKVKILDGYMGDIKVLKSDNFYRNLNPSEKRRVSKNDLYYAIPIASGMSGSPLINKNNQVVGVQLEALDKPINSCELKSSAATNSLGISIRKFLLQEDIPYEARKSLIVEPIKEEKILTNPNKSPDFIKVDP
jgi:Trypsin-like peptidase domain